jgi:hypothetical protein
MLRGPHDTLTLTTAAFPDVAPRCLVEKYQRSEETAASIFTIEEDGRSRFLRNAGTFLPAG